MEVISYNQLVMREGGQHIQKGMNFRVQDNYSIVLMSTRKNAPYADVIFDNGVIKYEGHDVPSTSDLDKKTLDQELRTGTGKLTENGKFYSAAQEYKKGNNAPEKVKVYRKLRKGIWVDMGFYKLIDAKQEQDEHRKVFKFFLEPSIEESEDSKLKQDLLHDRIIPGDIQRTVYERDQGKCQKCGSSENLHFDHIIPYSKGGSSKVAKNIQLLCAKHNLQKGAKFK